ncbi:MAG: hypothetical protein STSR0008_06370 [Ignavibacterium sp.]
MKSILSSKYFLIKLLVVIISIVVIILFKNISDNFNQSIEYLSYQVVKENEPDTNIVIIQITKNDIQTLNEWPLKRSYYALLINNLRKYNVKAIGLEIFLSEQTSLQSIYDNLLTSEILKSKNIILSSLPLNCTKIKKQYLADTIEYPSIKKINENIITGHIIYFYGKGFLIPKEIQIKDKKEKAFSVKLIETTGKKINESEIHLNCFTSWNNFEKLSLLEFFQKVNNDDSSLYKLKNKIILISVTDPNYSPQLRTLFDDELPGIALHAFAIDNMLNNRIIITDYNIVLSIVFLLLIFITLFLSEKFISYSKIIFYASSFIIVLFLNIILFRIFYLQFNYSFYFIPFLFLILSESIIYTSIKRRELKEIQNEAEIIKNILKKKENDLNKLEKELEVSSNADTSLLIEKIKLLKDEIRKLSIQENKESAIEISDEKKEIKNFYGIVYHSKKMQSVIQLIEKVAPSDETILILGETGTGKELVARALHSLSKRKDEKFITVNCGALTETILESELFGHIKGAFTGAIADKIGRFEAANNGTIFLDEIGETSENFQLKLLRVLQTGTFEKVGSSQTIKTNVRVIAATNKDLIKLVKEKKFREDLYYRLNVIKIELPTLRERKEDISVIANYFIKQSTSPQLKISQTALEVIENYEWKGNVRELESAIKRAIIFANSSQRNIILVNDLPEEITKNFVLDYEYLVLDSLRNKNFSYSSFNETSKDFEISRTAVSENFRGLTLKIYVESNYDIEKTITLIANSDEEKVKEKVRQKLNTYIKNINDDLKKINSKDFDFVKSKLSAKYKNLPKKFHYYLDEVIKKML